MRFECSGKIHGMDYPMVNTATFKMKDDTTLTVDRIHTEYIMHKDGTYSMEWRECYLHRVNDELIFQNSEHALLGEDAADYLNKAAEVILEIEDDVEDENAFITVEEWSCYN